MDLALKLDVLAVCAVFVFVGAILLVSLDTLLQRIVPDLFE